MSTSSCTLNFVVHKFSHYNPNVFFDPNFQFFPLLLSYLCLSKFSQSISLLQSARICFPWLNLELCDSLRILHHSRTLALLCPE